MLLQPKNTRNLGNTLYNNFYLEAAAVGESAKVVEATVVVLVLVEVVVVVVVVG